MIFTCKMITKKSKEVWNGEIARINNYGSHYEMLIKSRSSIMLMFGKTSRGGFACAPDFNAGCHLGALDKTNKPKRTYYHQCKNKKKYIKKLC